MYKTNFKKKTNFKTSDIQKSHKPHFWTALQHKQFGQLDFILVNQRWRNSFHNVETSLPQAITSDHKVLMAHMKTKLAKPRTKTLPSRKHYRQPTDEQMQDFNRHVEREIQDKFTQVVKDPFQIWASALLTAAEKHSDPNTPWTKKTVSFRRNMEPTDCKTRTNCWRKIRGSQGRRKGDKKASKERKETIREGKIRRNWQRRIQMARNKETKANLFTKAY